VHAFAALYFPDVFSTADIHAKLVFDIPSSYHHVNPPRGYNNDDDDDDDGKRKITAPENKYTSGVIE
jgi:hypothetical protein